MVTEIHAALGFDNVPLRLRKPPVALPTRSWRHYFPVAAAVVLVIALLGASFSTLVPDSDDGDRFASVPPVVLGVGNQSSSACDTAGDVPLFSGVDHSPIDSFSIVLTSGGLLKSSCNDQETVLSNNVIMAMPTRTSHVFQAMTKHATTFYNVATGENLVIPNDGSMNEITRTTIYDFGMDGSGDWSVMASTDDRELASIYNMSTFNEFQITDESGERVPIKGMEFHAKAGNESMAVIAFGAAPFGTGTTPPGEPFHGFFVVDTNGSTRFLRVQAKFSPRTITISPDSSMLAASSYDKDDIPGEAIVSLYDLNSGETIDSWSIETENAPTQASFLRDGSALIFSGTTKVYQVDLTMGVPADPSVLLEAENITSIMLTPDDEVIVVGYANESAPSETVIINRESGETITLIGRVIFGTGWGSAPITTTLVLDNMTTNAGFSVYDAVTGELLGKFNADTNAGNGISISTRTARPFLPAGPALIALDPATIWCIVDESGNATFTKVDSPVNADNVQDDSLDISISPDGFLSLRSFNPEGVWMRTPRIAGGEWIEINIENGSMSIPTSVYFIEGD